MFQIVLLHPEIPPNTGNVGRLCVGVGATLHLVKPLGFSIDDRSVKRAGLDYWKDLDLVVWESWEEFCQTHGAVAEERWHLFTAHGTCAPWAKEAAIRPGDFLLFGRETKGLPKELLEQYPSRTRTLPTPGYGDGRQVRSLNLSATVAAAVYVAMSVNSDERPI